MIDGRLIKAALKGGLTFIPGVSYILSKYPKASHSGSSAEFCYSFWLSVLSYFRERKIPVNMKNVGEIGTGGSLGMGICALLTGSESYCAFDIENIYNPELNINLLEEIVELFRSKKSISPKIPQANIQIRNKIPIEELTREKCLDDKFITEIRNDLDPNNPNPKRIKLFCNLQNPTSFNLDFLFSRAVMEHVKEPALLYKHMRKQVKTNSYMMHDIEFHSHDITSFNNDIHKISPLIWRIIYGNRKYFLNRWDIKMHIHAIEKEGFRIINIQKTYETEPNQTKQNIYGAVIIAKPTINK